MNWNDRLELLRWRAVEEADAEGELLPLTQRTEATRHVEREAGFLTQRAIWLMRHASESLRLVVESLHVPSLEPWTWIGWLLALATGFALAELGTDPYQANVGDPTFAGRLMNVLALPLMGLLLWNAVMILTGLIMEWRASSTSSGLPKLLRRRMLSHDDDARKLSGRIAARFHSLADPLLAAHLTSRARAWLHVGAAMLALGTIIGMYANGWSREYRVVWESTVLNQPAATRLLSSLYKPASTVFGIEIPLHEMASMRAGPGQSPQPQPALPWIHLYASTLLLLVIVPRLALGVLTVWRGRGRVEVVWSKFDWPLHEARLRSAISGTGLVIDVLSVGWRPGEEPRDRWSKVLREHFGALALLQFHAVPLDEADEFACQWRSGHAATVIVFNAASTPEVEVHPAFAREIRKALHAQNEASRLVVVLDASSLQDRRTTEALKTRLELWNTLLRGVVETVLICGA